MAFDLPPAAAIPAWLAALTSTIMARERLPRKELLEGSLYYPASGDDGDPVKYLGAVVSSFVYADYGFTHDKWMNRIHCCGFRGYHLFATRSVPELELSARGWPPPILPDLLKGERRPQPSVTDPFCEWSIFERDQDMSVDHGPQRFSLLYMRSEGVATFKSLYVENNTAPAVIAVIQPGAGFGRNWTDFRNERAVLAKTVLENPAGTPDFLLYGGYGGRGDYDSPCWSQFSKNRGFIRIPENEIRPGRRIGLWSK